MYSPFTFNPNVHRTTSSYQQQSGGYPKVGAQPIGGFMNHPPNLFMNHQQFTRSFASVVSCENSDLAKHMNNNANPGNINNSSNNSGILGSFFKHFNKPTMPQYLPTETHHKEFEDFTHMPSMSVNNLQNCNNQQPQHYYQQSPTNHINMKIPIISGPHFQSQQSANTNYNNMTAATRNFMASFFGGYQQRQQHQPPPPKPNNHRWFNKGFRCRGGRSKNPSSSKFHDHDVNLQKNIHKKERSNIERNIHDDSCDFVHIVEENKDGMHRLQNDKKMSTNNPNETAKGSCCTLPADDPPFMIYSLEEFPAIVTTCNSIPKIEVKSPSASPPAKQREPEKYAEGFVILPASASVSTPSFTPKRISLCEKIIKSPTKLFPKAIPITLKPCLKAPRRTVSECSDDFIVFAHSCSEAEPQDMSDSEDETDSEDDDDDVVFDGQDMTDIAEEDDESSDEEYDEVPEQQLDSGVEEKRVRFNMTPKVHVMRVWEYAARASRKGQCWQQFARDHERFRHRILKLQQILNPILDAGHRGKIYRERFEES